MTKCNSFKRWKHPLWAIVSEDSPYEDNWVGISLSKYPEILRDCVNKSPEFLEVIEQTKDFIKKFYQTLTGIAEEAYDSDILYDIFQTCDWKTISNEDVEKLQRLNILLISYTLCILYSFYKYMQRY